MNFKSALVATTLLAAGDATADDSRFAVANIPSPLQPVACEVRSVGPGGGGYLIEICASRHHPERVYIGCDVGGFYRSDDLGRHYRILNSGLETLWVNEIAEHPSDPETLLIGTKGGLYKSTDGGLHWKDLRPRATPFPKPDMYGHSWPISRIAWCERDPKRVWAATGGFTRTQKQQGKNRSEVWRSDDGGESWTMVVKPGDPLLAEKSDVLSLTAHGGKTDELLLTTEKSVFLSTDGGESWTRSVAGLPPTDVMDIRYAARSPSRPEVVYVTMRQRQGPWNGVPFESAICRSNDGGRTWNACGGRPRVSPVAGKSPSHWWNEALCVVDPKDPDTVWTTGPTWFLPAVCRSSDGGKTWKVLGENVEKGWINFWGVGARPLDVSPCDPRRAFFGTSGHVFATDDGGETWQQRYSEDRTDGKIAGTGLEVTCVRFALPDAQVRGRWYIGYWDIGLMISDDGGRSMRRCMDGIPWENRNSCFTLIQAPDEPACCWATFGNWGGRAGGIFAESADSGETWIVKTNGWHYSICPSLACVTDTKPHVLAAASSQSSDPGGWAGLQMSFDGGDSWQEVGTDAFPAARHVRSVCADGGVLYAGADADKKLNWNGGVWRSADRGKTWTRLTPPDMKMENVTRIVAKGSLLVAHARTSHFAKNGGGCYVSTDGGKSWLWAYPAAASADVAVSPDGTMIALAVPPQGWRDPGLTGDGVVISRDNGRTWKHLVAPGVDKLIASTITFDPHHPRNIWCGTGGNSVVVLRLPEAILPAAGVETRYLSAAGDDAADGRTPETAWRTLSYIPLFVILPCMERLDLAR